MSLNWLGRLLRGVRASDRHLMANHLAVSGVPETISLQSAWFSNGGNMPRRSAGAGFGDNVSPPLAWSGIPTEAVELAIIMEDPDVPLPWPAVHMIAYGIAPDRASLAEGALVARATDIKWGKGTLGTRGYRGPGPVPGHGPHRYVFTILALNRHPEFPAPPRLSRFLEGVSGTLVARGQLVGVYEQS